MDRGAWWAIVHGVGKSRTCIVIFYLIIYNYNLIYFLYVNLISDFPGGAVDKNPPANAEDMGSIPGLGRSHMPQST